VRSRAITGRAVSASEHEEAVRTFSGGLSLSLSLSLLAARQCPEQTPTAENKEFVEALACWNNKVCRVWIDYRNQASNLALL
jgi:hypothetical protein